MKPQRSKEVAMSSSMRVRMRLMVELPRGSRLRIVKLKRTIVLVLGRRSVGEKEGM